MDRDLFIQILDDELQESLAHYNKSPQDIIFQQDNDLKYTYKKAQDWFRIMDSLFYNDLHILIKRRLGEYETPPSGMLELWNIRIEAVLEAKGDHIKY